MSYTAYDLEGYAVDPGDDGLPFKWDPARRAVLRAELDAAYFHLYGVTRDDVDYIMDTFKVVRERDEKAYGEYRTKRISWRFSTPCRKPPRPACRMPRPWTRCRAPARGTRPAKRCSDERGWAHHPGTAGRARPPSRA